MYNIKTQYKNYIMIIQFVLTSTEEEALCNKTNTISVRQNRRQTRTQRHLTSALHSDFSTFFFSWWLNPAVQYNCLYKHATPKHTPANKQMLRAVLSPIRSGIVLKGKRREASFVLVSGCIATSCDATRRDFGAWWCRFSAGSKFQCFFFFFSLPLYFYTPSLRQSLYVQISHKPVIYPMVMMILTTEVRDSLKQ